MNMTWIKPLLLGMLALALVAGGWLVRGWKDGAAQTVAAHVALDAAAKQALQLNATNEITAKGMAALLTQLEGQAHAFGQIDAYLAAHPMGACTFDPATDRLWGQAYDAAFAHPTGSGHGQADPARPAARQSEPAHR